MITFKEYYNMDQVTDEMNDWFIKRTNKHIELVQKYAKMIEDYDSEFNGLLERCKEHDASKFEDSERIPYIFITWRYKCKRDGKSFEISDSMKDKMLKSSLHHVKNNKHHPEYWSEESTINREDRDKPPEEMVDATSMDEISIAEMVADWKAVGFEMNNSAKEWADKNVNIRWKFTDKQKDLIYELIEVVEGLDNDI